ncbi:large subunit ribosomal protein L37e [Pancytospora epiphaga]|nr:large subunit ribosomal protein L37e [Pancytospora epiphaga]
MSKGTPSFGKKNKRNHLLCPRCGNMAFHKQKNRCASCAFPEAKRRNPGSLKARGRCGQGCGSMRYMKRERIRARAGHRGNPILGALRTKQ